MDELAEAIELIDVLCVDKSIPRNVRSALEKIKELLKNNSTELAVKIDSAMQTIEYISLDPNLSSYARTQIWNLTSLLECILKS